MGILNVTPDSFSDGGHYLTPDAVEQHVEHLLAAGADIIDVGGESSRPFAESVPEELELARVIPAIRIIRAVSRVPISIDTTKAAVARAALDAGATMVNDISALRHDPGMAAVIQSYDGPVIIMHMQGTPATMQVAPRYGDVVADILEFFSERIRWMTSHNISPERIIVDPGIGFGKTVVHNLEILRNVARFQETGCPVLVGHSRKSFFQGVLGDIAMQERDCPTAVVAALLTQQGGVDILRVHDVRQTKRAVQLAMSLA